jgi:hypothetical protein
MVSGATSQCVEAAASKRSKYCQQTVKILSTFCDNTVEILWKHEVLGYPFHSKHRHVQSAFHSFSSLVRVCDLQPAPNWEETPNTFRSSGRLITPKQLWDVYSIGFGVLSCSNFKKISHEFTAHWRRYGPHRHYVCPHFDPKEIAAFQQLSRPITVRILVGLLPQHRPYPRILKQHPKSY